MGFFDLPCTYQLMMNSEIYLAIYGEYSRVLCYHLTMNNILCRPKLSNFDSVFTNPKVFHTVFLKCCTRGVGEGNLVLKT